MMLISFTEEIEDNNFIYQPENASVHAFKREKRWLRQNNCNVLTWPVCLPVSNSMENE